MSEMAMLRQQPRPELATESETCQKSVRSHRHLPKLAWACEDSRVGNRRYGF